MRQKFILTGALLSFLVPLSVYLLTLSPGLVFLDSGELATAAYSLGIPHPSGFPLWVFLTHFFTLLPGPNVAWTVSLASGVYTSAAGLLIYLLLSQRLNPMVSLSASLSFAFLKTSWFFSVVGETRSLFAALSALLLLLFLNWEKSRREKMLYLTALTAGLSLTHHLLFLILLPPIALYFLYRERRRAFALPRLAMLSAVFLLGLSFYLFLPIRSQARPLIDWGQTGKSWANFLNHVQRKQFSAAGDANLGVVIPVVLARGTGESLPEHVWRAGFDFVRIIFGEFTWPAVAAAALGLYYLFRKNRNLFYFFTVGAAFTGPLFIFIYGTAYSKVPQAYGELLPFYVIFTLLMAFGLALVWETAPQKYRLIVSLAFLLLPAQLLWQNFSFADFSRDRVAVEHGQKLFENLDRNAILVTKENDWLFPITYLSLVEKVRPDVTILDYNGNIFGDYFRMPKDLAGKMDEEIFRAKKIEELIQTSDRPVYFAFDKPFENYNFDVSREGILYKGNKFPAKKIDFYSAYKALLEQPNLKNGDTEGQYILAYYHNEYGQDLMFKGQKEAARAEFEKAASFAPWSPVIVNNVATEFAGLGDFDKAKQYYGEVLVLDARNNLAYSNLGTIAEEEKDFERAEQYYIKALSIKPTQTAILSLAGLYEKMGNRPKALYGYKLALQNDPGNPEILARVSRLEGLAK